MKYKLICLAAVALMLAGAFWAEDYEVPTQRYHQHLEQPGYTPCETHGKELFCSHLPLVVIETGGQTIPGAMRNEEVDAFMEPLYTLAENGEETIRVQVSIIDHENGNNHPGDEPEVSSDTNFRIRGHASRAFEKSPYLLKFVDEAGLNRDISVMGMGAHNEWVLHGPYLDKSLIRNYLSYNLAGEMMEWAPNVRYCEVFLDGEYRGLYLMTETVDHGSDSRLSLSSTEKNLKANGYLLRMDRTTEEDLYTTRNIYTFMERMFYMSDDIHIKYPGQMQLTEEMAQTIERDFAEFEKCIYSFDYKSKYYGYQNWIDVDSFVDYFIINELTYNADAGRYSTYLYKDLSKKYKMCVWDFNNAYDNFPEDELKTHSFFSVDNAIYMMLLKDEAFVERILERYEELRQGILDHEYICSYIDDTLAFLGPAVQRNSQRWADSITNWSPLTPLERNVYSQKDAVEQVKEFLYERGSWMDDHIHTLQQYSSESKNKAYNHDRK